MEKVEQYSANKKYKLSYYDFNEPRMGMSICRFSLTDFQTNEIIDFNPLWAIGIGQSGLSWNENEDLFSIALVNPMRENRMTDNFFIYDIKKRKFASIHFENCWILKGSCHNEYIEIEYKDDQIPERIEHGKYPTKKFTKPANLQFKFSDLKWIDIIELQQFNETNINATIHEFRPLDNGWRQFKGMLPQSTEIIIWTLEKFAEYGDFQSKEWLAEVEAKTDTINYWVKASHYLGLKIRKPS